MEKLSNRERERERETSSLVAWLRVDSFHCKLVRYDTCILLCQMSLIAQRDVIFDSYELVDPPQDVRIYVGIEIESGRTCDDLLGKSWNPVQFGPRFSRSTYR